MDSRHLVAALTVVVWVTCIACSAQQTSTTQALTPEQVEDMKIAKAGSLAGIGANLAKTNDQLVITAVYPGSPAEKTGLQIGQVITAINGVPVFPMALRDAVKLIRGPKGSKVELTVTEPPSGKTRSVTVVRDIVTLSVSYDTGRVLDANSDLSVGNLPPSVVKTVPQCGDTNVDPTLSQIAVTFSKDMAEQSWSFCNAPDHRDAFPNLIGVNGGGKYQTDKRTCVLNVALESDKTYAIWMNMGQYQGFRDSEGHPAVPYLLVFRTGQNK
jgi:hypothetical protein